MINSHHDTPSAASGGLFIHAGDAFSAMQLSQNVIGAKPRVRQQDKTVEPQIRCLSNDLESITTLPGDNGLGRLLPDLLQDGISPLRVQRGDIGASGISTFPGLQGLGQSAEDGGIDQECFPCKPL